MQKHAAPNQECWLDNEPKGIRNRSLISQHETQRGKWNQNTLELSKQGKEKPPGATWLRRG